VEKERVYLEGDIKLLEETAALKEAASVIQLPQGGDKQIDLQYFSAVFVSSGENLNKAYFMPSELVAAEGTIVAKALDVEHKEEEIIGHIYDRAFITKEGENIDLNSLSSLETASVDKQEMHVVIAGIIYKNRFPTIAKEVADNKWKVSMECYYQDFDVKIGDTVLSQREAQLLGLACEDDSIFGKSAKIIKKGVEIASGEVARVLRRICFSGCGIVKKPANPPSIVLETAKEELNTGTEKVDNNTDSDVIILDYDSINTSINNVTSNSIESVNSKDEEDDNSKSEERSELQYSDTLGICVSYKKEVIDSTLKDGNSKVLHTDWCSLYERSCTSFSRDTSDEDCLKRKISKATAEYASALFDKKEEVDKINTLVDGLNTAISEAVKINN
jgi:hypothetical protein